MKKELNLNEFGVIELCHTEITAIIGGDKFMRDVGFALGSAIAWYREVIAEASENGWTS